MVKGGEGCLWVGEVGCQGGEVGIRVGWGKGSGWVGEGSQGWMKFSGRVNLRGWVWVGWGKGSGWVAERSQGWLRFGVRVDWRGWVSGWIGEVGCQGGWVRLMKGGDAWV